MAKLPDDTALGGSPSASSGRPIATYDVTGYARGAAALAGGVADIGKGAQSATRDIAAANLQSNNETDALDEARANSNYLIKTKQLRDEISTATDPNGLEEKYKPQFQQAYDESAALISNPRKRELWTVKTAPDLTGQGLAVGDKVFKLQSAQQIADANDKLEQLRNSALASSDPTTRGQFIATGQQLISGLKEAGYIDAITEQKYRKDWTEKYAIGAISILPPAEQVNMLRESPQNKEAVLDRIGGLENSTGNPAEKSKTSSAMGDFQFINSTWLDTVKSHRPDLAQGHSDQELLALRADPKLSREMAGYLVDDNSAALRSQGITPTQSNLYLAHFLGAGTAAKVLKAPPGTPVADVVGADAINANRSVLSGKTTDSVIAWSDRNMGGSPRGKGALIDFIPEDTRVAMLQRAQAAVLNDNRKTDSDAALEQYTVKSHISDDLASMKETGVGLSDLTPEVVRRNFGSKVAQEWQDNRDDAHAVWIASHDLSSLNDAQVEQRLASIRPKSGETDYARKSTVFNAVQEKANSVRKMRVEDPAGSVSDDPAVKNATENLKQNDPASMQALQTARLAAQDRAGIGLDAQSPISKQEALALTAPLRQMLPGQERETLTAMASQFKSLFGDNADQAFAYALRIHKVDAATAQIAARVMKKLGLGVLPDASDTKTADSVSEISAAEKAVGDQSEFMSSQLAAMQAGAMPTASPEFKGLSGANVPVRAVRDLRANPELAGDFDAKYGKGTAKKILDNYPVVR